MHETPNARWVRRQLERRTFPHLQPPLQITVPTKDSDHAARGIAWYATDRRGVEVAHSGETLAALKRAPSIVGVWPGYGPMCLEGG